MTSVLKTTNLYILYFLCVSDRRVNPVPVISSLPEVQNWPDLAFTIRAMSRMVLKMSRMELESQSRQLPKQYSEKRMQALNSCEFNVLKYMKVWKAVVIEQRDRGGSRT